MSGGVNVGIVRHVSRQQDTCSPRCLHSLLSLEINSLPPSLCSRNMVRSPSLACVLVAAAAAPCYARSSSSCFVQTQLYRRYTRNNDISWTLLHRSLASSSRRWKSATINYLHNEDEDKEDPNEPKTKKELDTMNQKQQVLNFVDTILEIPDPRLFAGDLLFLLIINFLLQIASEVSTSEFWLNGGFHQPIAMPTTLVGVMVRDSKMSIAWILSALWNRSYAYSSVSNDETAIKVAIQVWIDHCSLRILLELGESIGFTHSTIDIWSLGMEVWYTVVIMAFFRLAYSRMTLFR